MYSKYSKNTGGVKEHVYILETALHQCFYNTLACLTYKEKLPCTGLCHLLQMASIYVVTFTYYLFPFLSAILQ